MLKPLGLCSYAANAQMFVACNSRCEKPAYIACVVPAVQAIQLSPRLANTLLIATFRLPQAGGAYSTSWMIRTGATDAGL